jgi:hypothetical protein
MKRVLVGLCVVSLAGGLAGCATTATPPAAGATVQVVDHEKVAAINRAASRNGVGVIWLTYPTKRVAAGG